MSTQLTLLPFGPGHEFSHAVLGPIEPVESLVEAVEAVQDAHGRDVPLTFNTYIGHGNGSEVSTHYGNTQFNADGSRLKHVAVGELLAWIPHYFQGLRRPLSMVDASWNAEAAWAYIAHLPEHWRVALYWH